MRARRWACARATRQSAQGPGGWRTGLRAGHQAECARPGRLARGALCAPCQSRRDFGNVRKRSSGRHQARYVGPDGISRTAPNTFATEREAQRWLTPIESEILKDTWSPPEAGEIEVGE